MLLARAVNAFEAALTVYTRDAMPADWALTQMNLGNALCTQGNRTEGAEGLALLARAVAAYDTALEVYTPENMPVYSAGVQNGLGNARRSQGERTGGAEGLALLARAVAAFDAALEIFTREGMTAQWAGTQMNLGAARWSQWKLYRSRTEKCAVALAAAANYANALEVFGKDHYFSDGIKARKANLEAWLAANP